MADIIDIAKLREAKIAARATDHLRDVLTSAATECAAGELSRDQRWALIRGMIEAFCFGDAGGWAFGLGTPTAAGRSSPDVLHKVLCLGAEEAAARILSAEGRGVLVNAVFLALGGNWRVERPAVV